MMLIPLLKICRNLLNIFNLLIGKTDSYRKTSFHFLEKVKQNDINPNHIETTKIENYQ